MMGNQDHLSVIWADVQISQGNFAREIRQKKNQKMIILLCQKILIKIRSKRGGPDTPPPPPTHTQKKSDLDCQRVCA